jgi:CBS domain-containing protein
MTIAAILRGKGTEVLSVEADTPIAQVVQLLADRKIGAVPVLANGKVAGILSERDIVHCLAAEGAAIIARPASTAMTAPAITASPDMPVLVALSLMTKRRIRHLPVVVEQDHLVGFVSIGDLVKFRIDKIEAEANAMRDYITGAG